MEDKIKPNKFAKSMANKIVKVCEEEGIHPDKVAPSLEGSIAVCFVNENRYADIEIFNNGEILSVASTGDGLPNVIELDKNNDTIREAAIFIGKFMSGE